MGIAVRFNNNLTNPATGNSYAAGPQSLARADYQWAWTLATTTSQIVFQFILPEIDDVEGLRAYLDDLSALTATAQNTANSANTTAGQALAAANGAATTLANKVDKINITPFTKNGVAVNTQGQTTAITDLAVSDIPALPESKITNLVADLASKANSSSLAAVATSGSYNDLSNKPTIPSAQVQADYGQSNSGAIDFIKNKPTLGTAAAQNSTAFATAAQGVKADSALQLQVSADWNAVSGAAQILNKPTIPSVPVASVFGRTGAVTAQNGDYSTNLVTENTNLYFTAARVLATLLAGISFATSTAVTAADSILVAIGKLQAQITGLVSSKEPTIAAGTTAQYWRGDKSWQTLDKSAVGLANVDNTADANKNVLSATKLTTARTINGMSFDGTANINIPVPVNYTTGGTANITKRWVGIVSPSTGNGYSVDISSAGFTNILNIQVMTIKNNADPNLNTNVAVKSYTNSAVVINITQGNAATIVILGINVLSGAPLVFANTTGMTVSVLVEGN